MDISREALYAKIMQDEGLIVLPERYRIKSDDELLLLVLRNAIEAKTSYADRGELVYVLGSQYQYTLREIGELTHVHEGTLGSWRRRAGYPSTRRVRQYRSDQVAPWVVEAVKEMMTMKMTTTQMAAKLELSTRHVDRARRVLKKG